MLISFAVVLRNRRRDHDYMQGKLGSNRTNIGIIFD